ncbi:MAG: phosphotriesterase [Anaerolineales bacterium]
MTFVRTVTGDIPPADLGITSCHDHLLWRPPAELAGDDPDLGLTDKEAARKELEHFRQAAGQSLVEMTTVELARDPEGLRLLSKESGIQIVAATGYNKARFSHEVVTHRSSKSLAQEMIEDLTKGMQGTHIQAGVIKAATSLESANSSERKVIEAVGLAHRQTGAPVSTHTEAGTFVLEQIDLLEDAGVALNKALIGHLDRKLEFEYHLQIAQRGVYMGFDQIGKAKYAPDELRADLIARLVQRGHGEQILLGMDIARKSGWPSNGFAYGPGLTQLLWSFLPRLRRKGLSEAEITTLVIDNPARWLAFKERHRG